MTYFQLAYLKKRSGADGYDIVLENWDSNFSAGARQGQIQSDPDLKNFAITQKTT